MYVLIILGIMVAGLVTWSARARRFPSESSGVGSPGGGDSVPSRHDVARTSRVPSLDRWVAAGLLDPEQAAAIAAFEAARAVPPRRVSLVTEALGYAGAALGVGGAAAALGPRWQDLQPGAQLGISAGVMVLMLIGGGLLRGQREAAFRRLANVLWLLAVGATAWTASVVAIEVIEIDTDVSWLPLLITGITTAMAFALWSMMPTGPQHSILYASSVATVVTVLVAALPDDPETWPFTVAIWGWGLVWLLLGWRELVAPSAVAIVWGTGTALAAPLLVGAGEGWLLGMGLATAAIAVAVSIPTHTTLLLAGGTVAMFGYVIALVVRYFGDSVGTPIALAAAGLLILGVAVAAGRKSRQTSTPPGAIGAAS